MRNQINAMKTANLKRFLLLIFAALIAASLVEAQIFSKLYDFGDGGGAWPFAGLVLSSNMLYGTTIFGGTNGAGTVFKVRTDGTGFTELYSFTFVNSPPLTNSDGEAPYAGLVLDSNTLYGTTEFSGSFGNGTIFKINTDGTCFTNLYDFSATGTNSLGAYTNSDGANTFETLVLFSNALYGTTEKGGAFGNGTIFKILTDGTGFTNLYSFSGASNGADPIAGLMLYDNTLYGTTYAGGISNVGTIFKINADGTGFMTLYDFTNGSDGGYPHGSLILSGNMLYGTTQYGGSSGSGAIFAINSSGIDFTNLYSFTASDPFNSDGSYPVAGLILSGSTLYGVAAGGGTGGDGTVFSINTDGTDFSNIHNIYPSGDEGDTPYGDLILSGNTLYGTMAYGGGGDNGTVFALSLGPIPLNIQSSGLTPIITWGNPAFSLQTASVLAGPWTTLSNAASPYTVNSTNAQAFFQLVSTNGT